MQALQKKQAQSQQLRDVLAGASGTIVHKEIEERVEHCKNLQYNEHQQLFAVLYSSIHKAACDNSIAGVKYFLATKQKPKVHIDDYDQHGVCPLHLAAERGHNDVVTFICGSGCDVDIRTTYGNTPMMYACKENKLDTIRLLYSLGAKLGLKNKAGQSAIHYAAQSDHIEVLKLIVELNGEYHNMRKELIANDHDNDNDSLDDSVKQGNSSDPYAAGGGRHFGAEVGEEDSVTVPSVQGSMLSEDVELQSILNITANNLMTPLHLACLFNSVRVAEFLLHQGVKVNAVDSSGDTALHKAGKKGYHQLYRTLLLAGADENIKNQFGDRASNLLRDDAFY